MAVPLFNLSAGIAQAKSVFPYRIEDPWYLLLIPLAAFLIWFIVKRDFIRFKSDEDKQQFIKSKRWEKKFVIAMRAAAVIFIIIALSSPYYTTERRIKGDPHVTIMVDNSTSFEMFDQNVVDKLIDDLGKHMPVKVRTIGHGDVSNIGDALVNNIEGNGESVLLVTDGWATGGSTLDNAFTTAAISETTINTIDMKPVRSDLSVRVEGPSQNIIGLVSDFTVIVDNVGEEKIYTLVVEIDGKEVIKEEGLSGSYTEGFNVELDQGYHTIRAYVADMADYFGENNRFLKTVQILPKPKVLFISQQASPFDPILEENYNLDTSSSFPDDLAQYYAVLLNDLPISTISPRFDQLNDYVTDGDGLVVIGGKNSYDRGGYEGTLFETLLPARIGTGVKSGASGVNVAILIDASFSFRDEAVDYAKALAIDIITNARPQDAVSVIAFRSGGGTGERTQTIVDLTKIIDASAGFIDQVTQSIGIIRGGGGTDIYAGLGRADVLLAGKKNVNLIVISDGQQLLNRLNTVSKAGKLAEQGYKVFTIGYSTAGLGEVDEDFLQDIADAGDGVYTGMDQPLPVEFIFEAGREGEEEFEEKEGEGGEGLIVYDSSHWIARGLSLEGASLSGYNAIVPKKSARGILYTISANNVLSAWQFGLGRVVAYGTDDGRDWSGPLLEHKSSELIPKMINWAITDPDRKDRFNVDLHDTRVGSSTRIIVHSDRAPELEGFTFVKTDENEYTAEDIPDKTGIRDFYGYKQAVNFPLEFQTVGMNPHFLDLIRKGTYKKGRIFQPDDIDSIVEKIKEDSEMIEPVTTYFRWPFVLIALIIYLIEICARRIRSYRRPT